MNGYQCPIVMFRPFAPEELWGFIPTFLNTEIDKPAAVQINDNYQHGGGWRPIEGFTWNKETVMLSYPGDEPMRPNSTMVFETPSRVEVLYLYPGALVLILQADGSWEVGRVD
jgi:hypothetical protein